jgi:hypothetical protein
MLDSRCAMTMVVVPSESAARLACTTCSVALSSAEVASSKTKMRGRFRMARAMARRCFSPPDSLRPRSPTRVA